mmetsp:Transcript_23042/g.37912  ORF Transcript_23042/g.37912 Transcript_23042/m.37912 type:complete len:424 (-) Transcript_23042:492-1763(-)|eukprot:CAMPEP_0184662826 /NCGR_PEP_ID=MMETSP0308-20130426/45122_1 /TAXON_ID=38269 /ORGANISM="Gloeochaete witrockiana, Strain SAG 46.84" /LENGTH=423 /DNA_ID=CAMNT_0027105111 /DNA_START=31 /DNA_END=1302 /DNA_ORIENTATION=-
MEETYQNLDTFFQQTTPVVDVYVPEKVVEFDRCCGSCATRSNAGFSEHHPVEIYKEIIDDEELVLLPPSRNGKNSASCSCACHSKRSSSNSTAPVGYFQLRDLWQFYDSPYGIEVPIFLDGSETFVYYVPYLSAVQLYVSRDSNRKADRMPSATSLASPEDVVLLDSASADPTSVTPAYTSLVPLISEQAPVGRTEFTPSSRKGPDVVLEFEFFESSSPDKRLPLMEQILRLSKKCDLVLNSRSCDLHAKSWYAIAWYPILTIPQTLKGIRGSFLTYHRFLFSEHYDDFDEFRYIAEDPVPLSSPAAVAMPGLRPPSPGFTTVTTSSSSRSPSPAFSCGSGDLSSCLSSSSEDLEVLCPPSRMVVPLIGFVPYKVRREVWFDTPSQSWASMMRVKAVGGLLDSVQAHHPDYMHCISSLRELHL